MLITITDFDPFDKKFIQDLEASNQVIFFGLVCVLSVSPDGARELLQRNPDGEPAHPMIREPTIKECQAWFHWQTENGRVNKRIFRSPTCFCPG